MDGREYTLFEAGYLDLVLMDHVRRSGHFRTHLGLLKPSLVFVDKCDCVTIQRFCTDFRHLLDKKKYLNVFPSILPSF